MGICSASQCTALASLRLLYCAPSLTGSELSREREMQSRRTNVEAREALIPRCGNMIEPWGSSAPEDIIDFQGFDDVTATSIGVCMTVENAWRTFFSQHHPSYTVYIQIL